MKISRPLWLIMIAIQVFRAVLAVIEHDWLRLLDVITIASLAACCLIWTSRHGSWAAAKHHVFRDGGAK